MTVCVAIKVHDCLVFAADSATSLVENRPEGATVANIWQHGIKVFNLHKGLPIAAMTAGIGHMGPASISTLAKDLRLALMRGDGSQCLDTGSYTIKQVTHIAREFFLQKYSAIEPKPANPHSFEFWIGGYGSDGNRGEIWRLQILNGQMLEPELRVTQEMDDSVAWGGKLKR